MKLNENISLSKKHKKTFDVFPYFFIPALNNFYTFHTEKGFNKPKLSTWRDEASIDFNKKEIRLSIQYCWPNYIDIRIEREGQPRNEAFILSKIFKNIDEDSASDIYKPLNEYLKLTLSIIYKELNKIT